MTLSSTHPGKMVAPTDDAQVLGAGMVALERSINHDDYADLLDKYGLDHIDPEAWYPLQLLLDMYTEMINTAPAHAMQNLVSIGMKVVDVMPQNLASIGEAVQTLNLISAQMLTGFDVEAYGYEVEIVADHHIRVTERSPFPHDLIYGYMYAIAHRYGGEDAYPIVERTYLEPDEPNSDGAIYDITW